MLQKYAVIDYSCSVNHEGELQSGWGPRGDQSGWSLWQEHERMIWDFWGKPQQSEWGWRWPGTWCGTGCYCTVGHTSVKETCESLEGHSSWGSPTTARRQDQRNEGAMLYLDYSLLIVPSLFALMSSVAGIGWGGALGWSVDIEYSHIKESTPPAVVPEVLGLNV